MLDINRIDLDELARRMAAVAPPFTPETADRLASIIGPASERYRRAQAAATPDEQTQRAA